MRRKEGMRRLGVNVDHVATVRQARRTFEPDPVKAAVVAEQAGAEGIVAHLREDRRHIQTYDVELIRKAVTVKFNLEMAATTGIIRIARRLRPDQATLVPEKRQEVTTEGGLALRRNSRRISRAIKSLQEKGIEVSLFIDPEPEDVEEAERLGADAVELHTGRFAEAKTCPARKKRLKEIEEAVCLGRELGLAVHAGHGLTYRNVSAVAAIPGIDELNIGHTIISRAVFVGLEAAVREMVVLVKGTGK